MTSKTGFLPLEFILSGKRDDKKKITVRETVPKEVIKPTKVSPSSSPVKKTISSEKNVKVSELPSKMKEEPKEIKEEKKESEKREMRVVPKVTFADPNKDLFAKQFNEAKLKKDSLRTVIYGTCLLQYEDNDEIKRQIALNMKSLEAMNSPSQLSKTIMSNMEGVNFLNAAQVLEKFFDLDYLIGYEKIKTALRSFLDTSGSGYILLGNNSFKGFLFYGPPGTGKTSFAKAFAKEYAKRNDDMLFVNPLANTFKAKFFGESETKINAFFDLLENKSKTNKIIVFIDEIDSILSSRTTENLSEGASSVTNAFLQRMDGVSQISNIIFIGATNNKDKIDQAALSRFSRQFEVKCPSKKQAANIFVQKIQENINRIFPNILDWTTDNFALSLIGDLNERDIVNSFDQNSKVSAFSVRDIEQILQKMQSQNISRVSNFRSFRQIQYEKKDYWIKSLIASSIPTSSSIVLTNKFKNILPSFNFDEKQYYPLEMFAENNSNFDVYVNWNPVSKERMLEFEKFEKFLQDNNISKISNVFQDLLSLKSSIQNSLFVTPEYLSFEIEKIELILSTYDIVLRGVKGEKIDIVPLLWKFWGQYLIAFLQDYAETFQESKFLASQDLLFYSGTPIFNQSLNENLQKYSWEYRKNEKPFSSQRKEQIFFEIEKTTENPDLNSIGIKIRDFSPTEGFFNRVFGFFTKKEEENKGTKQNYDSIISEYKAIIQQINKFDIQLNENSQIYLRVRNDYLIQLPIEIENITQLKNLSKTKLSVNPWSVNESTQLFDLIGFETNLFHIENEKIHEEYIKNYDRELLSQEGMKNREEFFLEYKNEDSETKLKMFDNQAAFQPTEFRKIMIEYQKYHNPGPLEESTITIPIEDYRKKWSEDFLVHRKFVLLNQDRNVQQILPKDPFRSKVVDFYLSKKNLDEELEKLTQSNCGAPEKEVERKK